MTKKLSVPARNVIARMLPGRKYASTKKRVERALLATGDVYEAFEHVSRGIRLGEVGITSDHMMRLETLRRSLMLMPYKIFDR